MGVASPAAFRLVGGIRASVFPVAKLLQSDHEQLDLDGAGDMTFDTE